MFETNQVVKDNQEEATPQQSQEEAKPLFGGTDSQGKERIFNSVEDAQQSWQSAQNFIKDKVNETKTLEAKVQELEAKLNQSLKLEDALSKINSGDSQVNDPLQQQSPESTPQSEQGSLQGVDVEQLTEQLTNQIMSKLTQSQQEQVYSANEKASVESAKAVYGEDYESKLRELAKGLDMSDDDILQEARTNPKRFKTLFGLDKQQPTTLTPNSRLSGVQPSGKPELNLNKGFSSKDKMANHLGNLRAIAKAKGLDVNF